MKNLLRFILSVSVVGFALAALSFHFTHKLQKIEPSYGKDHGYRIELVSSEEIANFQKPDLPDISGYTVEKAQQMLPDIAPGAVEIKKLKSAYPRIGSQFYHFTELQRKLEPEAIVVSEGIYDLKSLAVTVNDPEYLKAEGSGVVTLSVPLIVKSGAVLVLSEGEDLRLSVTGGAIIANFGKLYAVGAKITGWNEIQAGASVFEKDKKFRPYIVSWCGSEMIFAGSKVSHLGYHAPNAYGLTYTSCKEKPENGGAKGWLAQNEFSELYYGFYCYESDDLKIIKNKYYDSIVYGIDPHDRSHNLVIAENEIRGTQQKHGLIISREVNDSHIFRNVSEGNKGNGIVIDRSSTGNILAYNTSRKNGGDGLSIYESENNISYQNILTDNAGSGLRVRNSWTVLSHEDVIKRNGGAGIEGYTSQIDRTSSIDAYEQRLEIDVVRSELIDNKTQIKLRDIDKVTVSDLMVFQSSENLFSGDIKKVPPEIRDGLSISGQGVLISND